MGTGSKCTYCRLLPIKVRLNSTDSQFMKKLFTFDECEETADEVSKLLINTFVDSPKAIQAKDRIVPFPSGILANHAQNRISIAQKTLHPPLE